MAAEFWTQVALQDMTPQQWESLCDGCGKCCLHKLEDEETDELCFTSVACRHLNLETCRCSVYEERLKHVPDCVTLRPDNLDELVYLPSTCAYRLIYEGQELPAWHPLLSGDQNSVHAAHVSVRGKVISEEQINEEDLDLYIIDKL